MITEKPRLLNQEMIKAVLEGRKTQTRQPMKVQPQSVDVENKKTILYKGSSIDLFNNIKNKCPFGKPGDVLWFRETFYRMYHGDSWYGWSGTSQFSYLDQPKPTTNLHMREWRKVPSIHMPREACRLFGLVKRVWVERIQDISEEDAKAEGVELLRPCFWKNYNKEFTEFQLTAKGSFCTLWASIYRNWNKNPWVWCCEFETMNLEQYEEYKASKGVER